jgi:signal transduction histidine kinase
MQPSRWLFEDRIVEVTVTPMMNWRRSPRGSLYVLNDVTTRVQAEEALRASEARQRALLKAMPDLMFRLRQDGTFVDYHAPDPQQLMMPPEAFLGRRVRELMPEIIADREMQLIDQVVRTGGMEAFEYAMDMNGTPINFEARIVASGVDEVVFIVRNVTEQKQAEQRAFALALEKERVSLLTRFIQDSSHEFRTPLSVIEVSVHLLRKLTDPDKREQRMAQIEVQVERITHLVDMLVQMSRLDSGAPLPLRSTNPNNIVEQVAINQHASATKQRVRFRSELTEPLPTIEADAKQLLEALTQIVDNAMRYSAPADGESEVAEITLRTSYDEQHVRMSVEDTGVGIPQDALPHIFERFYRLDSAHSTPGFGLGLAIAHKIVELHGGTIEVSSEVGKGSRFTIVLPHTGGPALEQAHAMETVAP